MQDHKDGICPLCGEEIDYVGAYEHDDVWVSSPNTMSATGATSATWLVMICWWAIF